MHLHINDLTRLSAILLASSLSLSAQTSAVEIVADIPYAGTDNPRQMLDVILPQERSADSLPVVVYIHGGGWRNGSKDRASRRLHPLVATGNYVGISIAYRLSNEAQWPSQIHDCKAAIRWIRAHASAYGMDAERIGIFGTSAGGHLVSVLGTSGDVPEMEGQVGPHTDQSSRVTCVADLYGPTDFLLMNRTAVAGAKLNHDAPNSPESLLIGGPIQEHPDKVATANPMTYISRDDPPFLIIHGTQDPLVSFNQSEIFYDALIQADVESTLITVKDGGHGKGFPPVTNQLMAQFFDHHLRGITTEWNDQTVDTEPWQ
ncbi:alpha/beta hydrolase [Opitutaceae bacterium]|nr:alpha/beta hydrolase [Opitutaceae bacterium]